MPGHGCLNFEILDIVRAKRRKTNFPQKNIGSYLLSIRLRGETLFMCTDSNFTLKPDDVFYVPIGSKYAQYDKNDVEFICFHLEIPKNAPESLMLFKPEPSQKVREMFIEAADLWQKKNPGFEYRCMALLYGIFAETFSCVLPADSHYDILSPALSYINSHLFDPDISLDEVCKASSISRVYFNRLFMKRFGTTPVKYINHKRIEKAKLLLKSGSFAREEIALLCGYKDVKYFYTQFKKITGQTTGSFCDELNLL